MKVIKYLFPLWVGVLVYAIFSISFGAKGLSAYGQLELERERESNNIETLKNINGDLINIREALSADKEFFTVYARELGFAHPGEQFIRIVGLGGLPRPLFSPGQIISPINPEFTADKIFRVLSFFAAFTVLISMGAYDFLQFLKDR